MIAPKMVVFKAEPHRSVVEALAKSVSQNGPSGWPLTQLGKDAAEQTEEDRVYVEQARHEHQSEETRDDEVLYGIDAKHLKRVELLADLTRAEIGGDRGAGDTSEHDRGHVGTDLTNGGEHEDATQAI